MHVCPAPSTLVTTPQHPLGDAEGVTSMVPAVPLGAATICFPFAEGLMGGSHISALKLIQSLDRDRFHPLIVLHQGEGPFGDFLRSEGFTFVTVPGWHLSPGHMIRQLRTLPGVTAALARFLRKHNVRIVHTNEGAMHATWGLAARMAGVRMLWHHRGSPRARGLRFMAPLLADHVVSVSRFASPRAGLISAAGKCTVVHSPFDTEGLSIDRAQARAAALAELSLPEQTHIISFFGNLAERKRPLLFVDTIAAVRRGMQDAPIAGLLLGSTLQPGLDQAVLERARALGIADSIRLMGFRHPAAPWMAASDVLLVTAVDEPFGRTLIEAMLLRTPVVAADSGGNSEAIRHGENGLLATPDDAESLAAASASLLRDPVRAQAIADAAWQGAIQRFGIVQHSRAIMDIYSRMLADGA